MIASLTKFGWSEMVVFVLLVYLYIQSCPPNPWVWDILDIVCEHFSQVMYEGKLLRLVKNDPRLMIMTLINLDGVLTNSGHGLGGQDCTSKSEVFGYATLFFLLTKGLR